MVRKHRQIEPPVPAERGETLRHEIACALTGQRLTAREISGQVRVSEKEVYSHLEHIRRTLSRTGRLLVVEPAVCQQCGFVFHKRERLTKPGKCPICHSQHLDAPLFEVVPSDAKRKGHDREQG
ncbi:MAG: transcriptional regulator [Thermodesulfovibrionales bacterium]